MPNNSLDKSKNLNEGYSMEDFLQMAKEEGLHLESSSTSETQKTEQSGAIKTLEIRFVPNLRETSSSPQRLLIPFSLSAEEASAAVKAHLQIGKQGKPVKFIQIVGYPRPPQALSSKKPPTTPLPTKTGWVRSFITQLVG